MYKEWDVNISKILQNTLAFHNSGWKFTRLFFITVPNCLVILNR